MILKIKNGFILTMDQNKNIYQKGNVLVKDNRIVAVGEKMDDSEKPDIVIDAEGKLVMPGFINAHSHLQQYFRGIYELIGDFYNVNLPLESYRRPDDMEYLGLASCAEYIYGGCTTAMVIYTYPDGFAESVAVAGNRVILGVDIEEVDLNVLREGVYKYLPEKGKESFQRAKHLFNRWHGKADRRILTVMAPKAADLTTVGTYLKCKEFAKENGLRMTTHLAQSEREVNQVKKLYGKSSTQHLYDLGIIDNELTGAHCTYTSPHDLKLIANAGMGILHCRAVTNPFYKWMRMGIPVGLGTDDYYHDMLQLLRENIMGQRQLGEGGLMSVSSSLPSYYQLLELATRKGAEVLGIENETGSLQTGKKADIIIVDLKTPYITPTKDPITSFVLYGSSADIETVIVDGKILKRDKKLTSINLGKALSTAQKRTDQIIEKFFFDFPDQRIAWQKKIPYFPTSAHKSLKPA